MSNRQLLAGHTTPRTPHVDEHHSFQCFAGISEGLQNAKDRMHVLPLVLQLFVSLQRVLWQLPESCNRMLRKHFRCSTAGALCTLSLGDDTDLQPVLKIGYLQTSLKNLSEEIHYHATTHYWLQEFLRGHGLTDVRMVARNHRGSNKKVFDALREMHDAGVAATVGCGWAPPRSPR